MPESAFSLLGGQELLKSFESSPGKWRMFCSNCGSPLYSKRAALPGVLRVRAGLLDEPVQSRAGAEFYVASGCSWWPLPDDLPQFAEGAPPA